MHQFEMEQPEPDGRRPLPVNPPTFRWPTFGGAPYTLELGTRADLSDAKKTHVGRETFYRPPQPLAPGRYWWRVSDAAGHSQPVAAFDMAADTAKWALPDVAEALARLPTGRPRMLMRPEDLPRLRALARGEAKALVDGWAAALTRTLGRSFASEQAAVKTIGPDAAGLSLKEQHVARDYATNVAGPLDRLALVYLLNGDARIRDEIRRRTLAAAEIDPNRLTSHAKSDFANETVVVGLAWCYDALHADWTAGERAKIRGALLTRLRQAFAALRPAREQELFHAHGWQHVIQSMTLAALCLHDEEPEAREWFEWGYKMYMAHHPWWGGADGGSAEGLGYYLGHELAPSLRATAMFEAATGVSFFEHPWMRRTPYFLMYGMGLGDANSQFGDANGVKSAGAKEKSIARIFAARLGDPHVAAYAEAIDPGGRERDTDILNLLWHPLQQSAARPLTELPKSQAFHDVGVVYMRSALTEPANDIFFEFRSSPYAGFAHAHADQNSFNVTAFGDRLIIDSGYYYAANDKHRNGWAKKTWAHNSILVSGTGQGRGLRDLTGYGRISDYAVGDGFVRLTGSAATAYAEKAVKRFDRHVLWLQPDTYLIADDLETAEPQIFQWLLHAKNRMNVVDDVVHVKSGAAAGRLQFFDTPGLQFRQTDQFSVPLVMWRRDAQDASRYPNQWHLTVETAGPTTQQRFVSVLQVYREGQETSLAKVRVDTDADGVTVRLSDGRQGAIRWH